MSSQEAPSPEDDHADFPSEVPAERTWFDRLADHIIGVISNASFFLICILFVLVWLVFGAITKWGHWHEWADALAVPAAGVTLIMVALLENEGRRNDQATQRKLNAMATALAELMERLEVNTEDVRELRSAVGLEFRESTASEDEVSTKMPGRRREESR